MSDSSRVLGRVEMVSFPELHFQDVPARIDTGARTSAIWASDVRIDDGILSCVLFGPTSTFYTGQRIMFDTYTSISVASSNGFAEKRFKVKMLIKVHSVKVRASFTLANRQSQVYPVLIGRNILLGKFVVDVKQGSPLSESKRRRSNELQGRLRESGVDI